MAVAPSRRSSSARSSESRGRRCRDPSSSLALPTATWRPPIEPVTPLPVIEPKSVTSAMATPRCLRRGDDRGGERVLARPFEARAQATDTVASSKPSAGTTATTRGLPSVSVPVLSTTSVSIFSKRSSASAFLIRTPAVAPLPTPTMIDIGVARPSAHGQAMMSDRDGGDQRIGKAPAAVPRSSRPTNATTRHEDHGRARTRRIPRRRAAGSARGCAAPRQPYGRCARASCPSRPSRRASRRRRCR